MSEESGPVQDVKVEETFTIMAWLRYGSYFLAALSILGGLVEPNFGYIIGAFIALGCANKCASWAHRIGKSVNLAYGIGFFLGLVGLFGYWIYYNVKRI
jgi:hypothetical protein